MSAPRSSDLRIDAAAECIWRDGEKIGVPLQRNEQSRWESRFEPARRALGVSRSVSLLQDGRRMSTDQAITIALGEECELPSPADEVAVQAMALPVILHRDGR